MLEDHVGEDGSFGSENGGVVLVEGQDFFGWIGEFF